MFQLPIHLFLLRRWFQKRPYTVPYYRVLIVSYYWRKEAIDFPHQDFLASSRSRRRRFVQRFVSEEAIAKLLEKRSRTRLERVPFSGNHTPILFRDPPGCLHRIRLLSDQTLDPGHTIPLNSAIGYAPSTSLVFMPILGSVQVSFRPPLRWCYMRLNST